MHLPDNIPEVMGNAMRYFMMHGATLPNFQRDKIIELMGPGVSPVDFIVKTSEYLYAVADDLDEAGREVAAQAAHLAASFGWHDMFERGPKIVNAMKRKNGENTTQAPDKDPQVKEDFIEPAPEPEQPTPPGPPPTANEDVLVLNETDIDDVGQGESLPQ